MFGINLHSVIPMRSEAREQAEMCSQLLFGETFEIVEKTNDWYLIQNRSDGYRGWIDGKMAEILSEEELINLEKNNSVVVNYPFAIAEVEHNHTKERSATAPPSLENIILTGGSILYNYNTKKECAVFAGKTYYISKALVNIHSKPITASNLVSFAILYQNSPYLWGGKNVLGIDCSGFVQVVFRIGGIMLPRDCSQQVEKGKVVDFLQEAQTGDLAFFENKEGKISHVGILINNTYIIHASGRVKIEAIDTEGIISEIDGNYTHRLRVIKRII